MAFSKFVDKSVFKLAVDQLKALATKVAGIETRLEMSYTTEELNQVIEEAVSKTLPVGTIAAFPSVSVPTGWVACDGQALSALLYGELFSVIGYNFGGDFGMFNVPDLGGYSIFGYKSGDPDFGVLGSVGGERVHQLTISEIPSHNHPWKRVDGQNVQSIFYGTSPGEGTGMVRNLGGGGVTQNPFIESNGGDGDHNNIPPYMVHTWMIRAVSYAIT